MAKRPITNIYVEDDVKFNRPRIVMAEADGTEWTLGHVTAAKGIVTEIRPKTEDEDFNP